MTAATATAPASTTGNSNHETVRVDHQLIASMISPGARVLDVGCSDGALLRLLVREKDVDGRGLELSQDGVQACLRQGLSVIQGDADTDLKTYPDGSFDFIVLSQTLQTTRHPLTVLLELIRIGRYAIVSFPNFGHWRCRLQLLTRGRMPVTSTLPLPWHGTQNIHFCTIRDFIETCEINGLTIVRSHALNNEGSLSGLRASGVLSNLLGEQGVFLLSRNGAHGVSDATNGSTQPPSGL